MQLLGCYDVFMYSWVVVSMLLKGLLECCYAVKMDKMVICLFLCGCSHALGGCQNTHVLLPAALKCYILKCVQFIVQLRYNKKSSWASRSYKHVYMKWPEYTAGLIRCTFIGSSIAPLRKYFFNCNNKARLYIKYTWPTCLQYSRACTSVSAYLLYCILYVQ